MHGLKVFRHAANRIGCVFAFVFILAVTVNAYTIVMRGGRRVEIPSRFVVTASTLTYEVSPGVQVTLNVAAIDITATEKANNELAGSLMRRVRADLTESQETAEGQTASSQRSQPRRTITNRDLEASMRRRRDSELAYETRRKQLGLPSLEESRKQAAQQADLISLELAQSRIAKTESGDYWRQRATTLRTEMAALEAELAYVRSRLDEGPFRLNDEYFGPAVTSSISLLPNAPFGNFDRRQVGTIGGRRAFPSPQRRAPGIFVSPSAGVQISGRAVFGGGPTRRQVFVNSPRHVRSRSVGVGLPLFQSGVVSSAQAYDLYERSELITRFNELAAARAGLRARWRELEDEARRAGAPPGWLRP